MDFRLLAIAFGFLFIVRPLLVLAVSGITGSSRVALRVKILLLSHVIPILLCAGIWLSVRQLSGKDLSMILLAIFWLAPLFSNTGYLYYLDRTDGSVTVRYLTPIMMEKELVVPADENTTFYYWKKRILFRSLDALVIQRGNRMRQLLVTEAGIADRSRELAIR